MNVSAHTALQIIPEHLHNEPVFLCIDDIMVAKFGRKFENVSKLFGHASHMVSAIMPELAQKHQVLLLFDSWYAKKPLVCLADKYENLDIICNARYDSAIYNLPKAPTGKRGRPSKRGKKLSIIEDFSLSAEKVGDYYVGVRKVITNIFGDRCVHAYVTAVNKTTETRRLFFSTIAP